MLCGHIAVSYLRKVTDAKNFAALLHKLSTRCLVNLYDVWKIVLSETGFSILLIF